jgi:hypothetical protein
MQRIHAQLRAWWAATAVVHFGDGSDWGSDALGSREGGGA